MQETQLHIKYCETFNIPLSELQNTQELQGTLSPPLFTFSATQARCTRLTTRP